MDALAKDTLEQDLWEFEEKPPEPEKKEAPAPIPPPETAKPAGYAIPGPRQSAKPRLRPTDEPPKTEAKEGIKMNVGKNRPTFQPPTGVPKPESDFDELDHWDESEPAAVPEKAEPAPAPPTEPPVVAETPPSPEAVNPPVATADDKEEFSPSTRAETAAPLSRPRLGLSKLERIGLIGLLALLVIGGGVVFLNAIGNLPSSSAFEEELEFPIEGKHVAALSAETFWRVPVTTGEKRDTVRRGTEMIPVVALQTRGGAGAVRVFFVNSEGNRVGDAVIRPVSSERVLDIAATAGFEEAWMYDAYRTGNGKPWKIEVFEAPSASSPVSDFKLLFEMNVSSERR